MWNEGDDTDFEDHYAVLGLLPALGSLTTAAACDAQQAQVAQGTVADSREVARAYRRIALTLHPDKQHQRRARAAVDNNNDNDNNNVDVATNDDDAVRFAAAQRAAEVLGNSDSRQTYDATYITYAQQRIRMLGSSSAREAARKQLAAREARERTRAANVARARKQGGVRQQRVLVLRRAARAAAETRVRRARVAAHAAGVTGLARSSTADSVADADLVAYEAETARRVGVRL